MVWVLNFNSRFECLIDLNSHEFCEAMKVAGSKSTAMYFENQIISQSSQWCMHPAAIWHAPFSSSLSLPYAIRAPCFNCLSCGLSVWTGPQSSFHAERYYASRGATAGSFVISYLCTVIADASAAIQIGQMTASLN